MGNLSDLAKELGAVVSVVVLVGIVRVLLDFLKTTKWAGFIWQAVKAFLAVEADPLLRGASELRDMGSGLDKIAAAGAHKLHAAEKSLTLALRTGVLTEGQKVVMRKAAAHFAKRTKGKKGFPHLLFTFFCAIRDFLF